MSKFYYLRVHSALQKEGTSEATVTAIQAAKEVVKALNNGDVSNLDITILPVDCDDFGNPLISIDYILLD